MKRLLFITILAASASACVEGNNPVQLLGAYPLDSQQCGSRSQSEPAQYNGMLNYNLSTHYILAFGLYSPLEASQTAGGSGFIGEQIVYNYESQGVKSTYKEETMPVYLVVNAGSSPDESFVIVDLIGDEARKKLDSLVPTAPDTMTLLSTIKIKGRLVSGKSVETNEVTFPITLTRGASCPSGTVAAPPADAPCVNPGQDGKGFQCVTALAP